VRYKERKGFLFSVTLVSLIQLLIWSFCMKLVVMILNSMFLLLFISAVVGEWGKGPAIMSGIAIVNIVINSVFILLRTKGDFEE
jgi:hypothetical protein